MRLRNLVISLKLALSAGIAAGTSEVNGTIADISADVARTDAESEKVLATASELARQSHALRSESDSFLDAAQKAA